MSKDLGRNIRCYPWLQFSSSLLGWLPVFFLYFSQFVSLSEVIQLGAIYYIFVCLFEVPSGYFSDRLGRRLTLMLSALSFISAYCSFLLASGFTGLAIGQGFTAMAIALMSGTDTALLYDSLIQMDRESDYTKIEAKGQKYGMFALAIASLVGGSLGLIDLKLPYYFSLIGAAWMFWIVLQLSEPDNVQHKTGSPHSFLSALRTCFIKLKDSVLKWLFLVMVLMYCLEHIAYEFYQPYIKLLNIDWLSGESASLISGIVIAASMFGGSLGAAYSVRLEQKIGLRALLYCAFAVQLLIICGLSVYLSGLLLSLVIFRNFPMAMIHPPVHAAIGPRIDTAIRATYLSVQSLSARLVFSALLFVLSSAVAGDTLNWDSLALVLRLALAFGIAGVIVAIVLAPASKQIDAPKS